MRNAAPAYFDDAEQQRRGRGDRGEAYDRHARVNHITGRNTSARCDADLRSRANRPHHGEQRRRTRNENETEHDEDVGDEGGVIDHVAGFLGLAGGLIRSRSIRQRTPDIMAVEGVDFEQPVERYSALLLQRQRMLGRLQLDFWALAIVLEMQQALEIEGVGITCEPVREPAEPRSETYLLAAVESPDIALEILTRQRRPHAEAEALALTANDRQFEHRAHEEVLAAEHAEIFREEVTIQIERAVRRNLHLSRPLLGIVASEIEDALVLALAGPAAPRPLPYAAPSGIVGEIVVLHGAIISAGAPISIAARGTAVPGIAHPGYKDLRA